MARRQLNIELDESLFEAVRAIANRSGVPEDELYEVCCARWSPATLPRSWSRSRDKTASGRTIGADDALRLAVDEVRATREERRSEP